MKKTALWMCLLLLSGCSSESASQGDPYSVEGGELNRLVSDMADRLFTNKLAGNTTLSPIQKEAPPISDKTGRLYTSTTTESVRENAQALRMTEAILASSPQL